MYRPKVKELSNKSRVLECIFRCAPIAKIDIAEDADITPATVTLTVSGLVVDGMARRLGEADSEKGSSGGKRTLVDMAPDYTYSIGVEFTQKALVTCITDLKGTCIYQSEWPFNESLPPYITEEIIERTQNLLGSCQLSSERIIDVGVAVSGHMDKESRYFISNHTVQQSFDSDTIRRAFPYPVVMGNNARCMAPTQYLFSPGSSPENFSLFHVGLGMFHASVTGGELFLDSNYASSKIGHTIIEADGQPYKCSKYGCLQTIASEQWLLKYARLLYQNTADTTLHSMVDTPEELTIRHIATAYSMGDTAIDRYITDVLKYLGISISNVAILMNPGKILLHGQLFQNKSIRRELMNIIERRLLFVGSEHVNNVKVLPYRQTDGTVSTNALSVSCNFIQKNEN